MGHGSSNRSNLVFSEVGIMSYCPDNLDQWYEEDRRRTAEEQRRPKCEICEETIWDGWEYDGSYIHDEVDCIIGFLEENGTLHEALTQYLESQGAKRI